MPVEKHIVVLGGGFGGLTFCKSFSHPSVRISLIDRHNHYLFQPLLYQVATAGLSMPDIAQPIRSILSDYKQVTVLLNEVCDLDLAQRLVHLENRTLSYDYLVLALGSVTSYFGHPEWELLAPGLKTLEDAIRIRRRVLLAFEKAENEQNPEAYQRLMTVVVVGGGPTGVEMAGALAELAHHVLKDDFRHIDPTSARIILIEAGDRILGNFSPELSQKAHEKLEAMGVEVRTNRRVKNITPCCVEFENEIIAAENIVWAAGVGASPLTRKLGVELDRAGRIKVMQDLSLPGHPEVFAIGDMALVIQEDGSPVPGVSPAAMQMARHVSDIIQRELDYHGKVPRKPFLYFDKGSMATIGRSAAVAKIGKLEFNGFAAWFAWLFIHLIFLIGLRNKISVFLQWLYSYVSYKRGARIIFGEETQIVNTSESIGEKQVMESKK